MSIRALRKRLGGMTLGGKLALINAVLLLVFIAAAAFFFIKHHQRAVDSEFKRIGELISGDLARRGAIPLLAGGASNLAPVLDEAVEREDVEYAAFYSGRDLIAWRSAGERGAESIPKTAPEERGGRGALTLNKAGIMEIYTPVHIERLGGAREEMIFAENLLAESAAVEKPIGHALIGLSTARHARQTAVNAIELAVLSLVIYAASMAVMIAALRRYAAPLTAMSELAVKAADGDLGVRMAAARDNEVGRLAASFNMMIESLAERMDDVKARAQEIENLMEGAMDGIFLVDDGLAMLAANREMARALGRLKDELDGADLRRLLPPEDADALWRAASGDGAAARMEMRFKSAAGELIPFEVNASPVWFRGKRALLCFARDVTERKRIEERLVQTEKLSAAGRLAADVAHEVNNPLAIIKNYLYVLRRKPQTRESVEENVTVIEEEIDRIAGIVRGLLSFSRMEPGVAAAACLNDVVAAVLRLSRGGIERQGVRIETALEDGLRDVAVPANLIEQVIFNLINNAVDAMNGGGTLTIATQGRGDSAALVIEDTGSGIDEKHLSDIFTPFYTTKGVKGTGLGLSITYGIIKSYKGEISIENRKEGGVRATVLLPHEKG